MTTKIFNICLLAGWLMIVLGVALWSVPAAFVAGGVLLVGLTLLLAYFAGVVVPRKKDED